MSKFDNVKLKSAIKAKVFWKGRYDPSSEPALREALKDPSNPIRRVLEILLASAKEMVRDGRMKIVDGVSVFRDDVKQMLAERKARRHSRCSKDDPCGGVHNPRAKTSAPGNTHVSGQAVAKSGGKPHGKTGKVGQG